MFFTLGGVVQFSFFCHDRNPHHLGSQGSFFLSNFGSDTPLMLLAKLKVKENKVATYLKLLIRQIKLELLPNH